MPAAAPEDDFEWHDADTSTPAAPEATSAASEQAAIAPGSFDDDDDDFGDFDGAPSAWAAAPAAPAPAQAQDTGASTSTSTSAPAVPLTPMQPAAAAPAPASPAAPSTAALGIPSDPDLLALSDDDFRRAVATAWLSGGSTTSRAATAEAAQQLLDQARRRLLPSGAEPGSVLFHAGVPMASASLPHATPSPLPTPAPTPTSARPPLGRPSLPSVGSMSNLGPTLVWKGPLGQVYQPVARWGVRAGALTCVGSAAWEVGRLVRHGSSNPVSTPQGCRGCACAQAAQTSGAAPWLSLQAVKGAPCTVCIADAMTPPSCCWLQCNGPHIVVLASQCLHSRYCAHALTLCSCCWSPLCCRSTSQMHWCGSESEQRLLSSLGLWDLAQQVRAAEPLGGWYWTPITDVVGVCFTYLRGTARMLKAWRIDSMDWPSIGQNRHERQGSRTAKQACSAAANA